MGEPASDFRPGDTVRWKSALMPGGRPGAATFTVTEAGLQSTSPVMPGEQVRARKPGGELTRLWVSDIELVPGAGRGPEPGTEPRRGKCRYCSRTFTLRDSGRVRSHTIKGTGRRCGGSGQVPA